MVSTYSRTSPGKKDAAARESYRHGDLKRALIEAGLELARTGGPEAVILREATRRAGVVPNAAYRHFASRDDLLEAVREAALAALAGSIENDIALLDPSLTGAQAARANLKAIGTGYLRFASAEPGLFRAAFVVTKTAPATFDVGRGASGLNPFELLGSALDKMVAAGLLPEERRAGAEFLAWSSVHGLAVLSDGPLSRLSEPQSQALGDRLIAMVERGL